MRIPGILSAIMIGAAMLNGCRSGVNQDTSAQPPAEGPAQTTETAGAFPAFKVKSLDGEEKDLSTYRGKIVILDLFATWCPPCRNEIPHFVELQEKYRDRLSVVGLSYDQSSAADVKRFAQEMKINYDVLWGSEEIARYVGLRGIPHTLVLDAEGKVAQSFVGYRDKSVFEQAIAALSPAAQP